MNPNPWFMGIPSIPKETFELFLSLTSLGPGWVPNPKSASKPLSEQTVTVNVPLQDLESPIDVPPKSPRSKIAKSEPNTTAAISREDRKSPRSKTASPRSKISSSDQLPATLFPMAQEPPKSPRSKNTSPRSKITPSDPPKSPRSKVTPSDLPKSPRSKVTPSDLPKSPRSKVTKSDQSPFTSIPITHDPPPRSPRSRFTRSEKPTVVSTPNSPGRTHKRSEKTTPSYLIQTSQGPSTPLSFSSESITKPKASSTVKIRKLHNTQEIPKVRAKIKSSNPRLSPRKNLSASQPKKKNLYKLALKLDLNDDNNLGLLDPDQQTISLERSD